VPGAGPRRRTSRTTSGGGASAARPPSPPPSLSSPPGALSPLLGCPPPPPIHTGNTGHTGLFPRPMRHVPPRGRRGLGLGWGGGTVEPVPRPWDQLCRPPLCIPPSIAMPRGPSALSRNPPSRALRGFTHTPRCSGDNTGFVPDPPLSHPHCPPPLCPPGGGGDSGRTGCDPRVSVWVGVCEVGMRGRGADVKGAGGGGAPRGHPLLGHARGQRGARPARAGDPPHTLPTCVCAPVRASV